MNDFKKVVALALLGQATTAMAEPVWDKVEFGMTRSQVEALYPKGDLIKYKPDSVLVEGVVVLGDKCKAESNIYFKGPGNTVDQVKVSGNPSMGGRCSDQVMTALASKYGEPLNRDSTHGSLLARQGKIMVWNRPGGVTMRFKKYENGVLGGGGLGQAAWEITYTQAAGALAL